MSSTQNHPSPSGVQWLINKADFFGQIANRLQAIPTADFESITLNAEELLIKQGGLADRVYIVVSGQLKVVDDSAEGQERPFIYKNAGEGIGKISIADDKRHAASAYATCTTKVISISHKSLNALATSHPEIYQYLYESIRKQFHDSILDDIIRKTDVFQNLDGNALRLIRDKLELTTIKSGEVLMRAGDKGDALYFVLGGRLRVELPATQASQNHYVDTSRGQTVGEIGLITGDERTAHVFAVRDTLLAKLSYNNFKTLLKQHPEMMMSQFAGGIINRLNRQLSGELQRITNVTTVAIVPISPSAELTDFAQKISKALKRTSNILYLDSQRCDSYLGTEGISHSQQDDARNDQLIFWLNEQEAIHDFVIFETDFEPTQWTKRCIRQADLVVLLGDAKSNPSRSPIEQALAPQMEELDTQKCLVLLHDEATKRPENTAAWLKTRQLQAHYHARLHRPADIRRVGRLLTGQGIGLVLSGGGVRATAQLGIIRALREKGVPIDMVCGVSGGSMTGALWALHHDTEKSVASLVETTMRGDYTFPDSCLHRRKGLDKSHAKPVCQHSN